MKKSVLKTLALICLLALMFSLSGSAWAATAELSSTQNFLDFLDEKEIKYTYEGMSDGREEVSVSFSADNFSKLECKLFFKDDCEEVSLRIWNIVEATAGKNFIFSTLNAIHKDYKFVKYVYDDSDSTVQAELDVYIDADHCGRSVYDSLMVMINLTDRDDVAEKLHSLE